MGMIERIARTCAIWADHHDPDAWRAYQGVARLILAEMRTPTTAMGIAGQWQMISFPLGNGTEFQTPGLGEGANSSWERMIDAALAEPDQTKPE